MELQISLTTGFTMFGIAAIAAGLSHEYDPVFSDEEAFVEIQFPNHLSDENTRNLAEAYLFELASSHHADFKIVARAAIDDWDEDAPDSIYEPLRFRPLMVGKGMTELLQLFSHAVATPDPEIQILYFAKVVEFVAQTVVNQQAVEAIRSKLLSARCLTPDVEYITELRHTVSKSNRTSEDDGEAIKQTIISICEPSEIARYAPPFLGEFRSKKLDSDPKARKAALAKLGLSLYATRNSIAHAKANYTRSGHECPAEEFGSFAECVRIAAEQAVRWYHSSPVDIRVA
jgi:hypothetical protein